MLIGYARVSTQDSVRTCRRMPSGKQGMRGSTQTTLRAPKPAVPQLDRMLDALGPGDTVVVWKLDRLGRSLQDLVALMDWFREMDVGFRCTTQQIDTTTPGGVLVFNAFAAVAQFDRDLISAQTNAGLSTARKRPSPSSLPPSRDVSPSRWCTRNGLDMMTELYAILADLSAGYPA